MANTSIIKQQLLNKILKGLVQIIKIKTVKIHLDSGIKLIIFERT